MTTTRLIGIDAIKAYAEHSWETIRSWIENDHFPATRIGRRWVSDKRLIDNWFCDRITTEKKAP